MILLRLFASLRRKFISKGYAFIVGKCGKNLICDCGCRMHYPKQIFIKNNVCINRGVILQGTPFSKIFIGNNVVFSYSSMVLTASLCPNELIMHGERTHVYKDVVIGDNVWIAANVTILPGVHIANNVVIASGAVVCSDIKSRGIYGGIPAKLIKSF